jgi:hypothetical protein
MSDVDPTPLERSLLGIFHQLHGAEGFPSPSEVSVISRENTGGGRYVSLKCADRCELSDGHYDLGGKYIEMAGIPHGMMAVARVAGGHLVEIEIAVYGDYHWDGSEREWSIR